MKPDNSPSLHDQVCVRIYATTGWEYFSIFEKLDEHEVGIDVDD